MAIDPVLSVSFEALRGLSLADSLREGRILEARVTAMLTDTLARLSIAGQDIDVATPERLPVGAQLTLRAEREGGQLRLITQAPIRMPEDTPSPVTGARQAPEMLIEPGRALMAQIQTIAMEAMLDNAGVDEADLPQAATRPQAQTHAPTQAQTQAQTQDSALSSRPPPDARGAAGGDIARQASMRAVEALLGGSSPIKGTALPPILPPLQPGESETAQLANLLSDLANKGRIDGGRLASILAFLGGNPAEEAPLAQALFRSQPALPGNLAEEDVPLAQTPPRAQPGLRGAEAPPAAVQQPPETQGKSAPDAASIASMLAAEADKAQPEARREATMDAIRAYVAAETPASQTQAGRQAPLHIEVPVYFPGNQQPLHLQVTRDGEAEEGEDGEKRPRSWTIRFAAEAGSLGMIHAAISMVDERIGVQLWAENSDTAASFRQDMAQLHDALEASNLQLEALKIQQGSPPAEPSGAEKDAGR